MRHDEISHLHRDRHVASLRQGLVAVTASLTPSFGASQNLSELFANPIASGSCVVHRGHSSISEPELVHEKTLHGAEVFGM